MKKTFCDTHILAFLKEWRSFNKPLDLHLSQYFRSHKNLGSHDRKKIGESIYTLIRWKSLFDVIDKTESDSFRLQLLPQLETLKNDPKIDEWARLGLSPFLYQELIRDFGPGQAKILAEILNTQAPTTIRTNLLKTTRKELFEKLKIHFDVRLSEKTETAIYFSKREPLFGTAEFKEGLFEVQDEASQMIASLVEASKGDRILDFCSGSGGKSLSIAPRMEGKGELYLHDIRKSALLEAKKRLRRAGIQNSQILPPDHPTLKKLVKKMDFVLVDAPCTGSGTLRRNPEMKWKIDQAMLDRLALEQRTIFKQALQYVKPGGKLIYATCSLFSKENEAQVEYFKKTHSLTLNKEPLKILPELDGHDGFFGAVFNTILV